MSDGITAVMLNWKRPVNVNRIMDGWEASALVNEGFVWNNNPTAGISHSWARVINTNVDMGLYTRFAVACLAKHECVMIQDDDLELSEDSIRRLYAAWQADPEIIHGMFGRAPKHDGSYARDVKGDAEVPVVLTRVLMAHRRYAHLFFESIHDFDTIQRDSKPFGNGEDLIFSYVAVRETGRLNRVHNIPVTELSAPHAIHARDWNWHIAHRTRVMRACEAWVRGGRP